MNGKSLPPKSWPYLRTPLRYYLLVMVPVCVLHVFIFFNQFPTWMRISATGVLVISVYGLLIGYVRRLVLTEAGAELRSLRRTWKLDWPSVRRVGTYAPGGGLGTTEYLYITQEDTVPPGPWQIDSRTLQIQNREGLLGAVQSYWQNRTAGDPHRDSKQKKPRNNPV